MKKKVMLSWVLGVFLLLGMGVANAQQAPDEVIRVAVDKLVKRIEADRQRLESDPQYAQKVVNEELEEMVDFRRITRAVMGDYFSQASRDQRHKFLVRFRASLVNTYAAGITLYEGQSYRILPLVDGDVRGNRARVQMEFEAEDGKILPIAYTMTLTDNQWKVDNVIVNNLNLGRIFQTQFAQDMAANDNNLDIVIANWSADLGLDEISAEATE